MQSEELEKLRNQWRFRGQQRPEFAVVPEEGQESVWDYPRPPVLVAETRHVVVRDCNALIAESNQAFRMLETSGAPCFYLSPMDIEMNLLARNTTTTFCEWKGHAVGFDSIHGVNDVAWSYLEPYEEFTQIAGWLAFYPNRVACFVEDERVRAQPGGYYGGWITSDIVGPFKGELDQYEH